MKSTRHYALGNTKIVKQSPTHLTAVKLPHNVQSGDVIFASPSGEMRTHKPLKWYQKWWIAIDDKVRTWVNL